MESFTPPPTLLAVGLEGAFYLITIVFIFFSLFMIYHWFTYGTERAILMLALAIYLFGSLPLFLIMSFSLMSI